MPRTTSTRRSCSHSSSGSSHGRSRKSGCPVRAISCRRTGISAAPVLVVEREEHRVRPEERRGREAQFRHALVVCPGVEEVVLRLLRQAAVRRRVRRDPLEALSGTPGLGQPQHRREQDPLAAAVVDVVEVTVDAAAGADELRDVHGAEAEQGNDEEAGVEPLLRPRKVELIAESGCDAGECCRVNPLALLPPVHARLLADSFEISACCGRRVAPAVTAAVSGRVLADGPEEEAPAIVLALRPLALVALAVERVAGLEAESALDDARDPVEEALRARHLADAAHCVGDEGAVPEPGEAIGREGGAGDVAAARRLSGPYRLDARAPKARAI